MRGSSEAELPVGWASASTDLLYLTVTSRSRGWAQYYSGTGPLFLRIGNLDHDSIALDLSDIQRVTPPEGSEGTRTRVQKGDLLISITADVGMVGLVQGHVEEAYINQHVALARPINEICRPYLAWYLASATGGQRQFKALQRGATKVGLGLDDIRSVIVPLAPVPEQYRIVEEIEKQFTRLEAGVAALKRVQANLKRYRAAVLKAACEGRLVPTEAELARSGGRTFETSRARGRPLSLSFEDVESTTESELPPGWLRARVSEVAEVRLGRQRSPARATGPNMRRYLRAANRPGVGST